MQNFVVLLSADCFLQDIENATAYISNVVEGGGTVYVHCKGEWKEIAEE